MKTNYEQHHIVSPFQPRKRTFDVQGPSHPVQEEIKKCLGTMTLTVTVERDILTLQQFEHIPGTISFLCTIRQGNQTIGIGRGTAVISRINKFVERTVRSAFCASLVDGIVRSTRMLDALYFDTSLKQNTNSVSSDTYGTQEVEEFIPLSSKQKSYLLKLLQSSDASDEEFNQVDRMSKDEAREKINLLVTSGDNIINY